MSSASWILKQWLYENTASHVHIIDLQTWYLGTRTLPYNPRNQKGTVRATEPIKYGKGEK